MAEASDAVLAYWSEHRQQLRQSEQQRSTLTNYVLIIASALGGFTVQQNYSGRTLPLSVLVVLIGLYGSLTSMKYHERSVYHLQQARALTASLRQNGVLPDLGSELEQARLRHYVAFPRMHRLRLHALWTALHAGVALFGILLVALTVVNMASI
ncbi:hypothetical protein [Geodermatophilus obscurus]|uniref:hypothetical protein n=1 Tax=Geodermatophilus obscurus TaxID=1861 RepID=UPI0009D6A753|nr:hypothetical protein [Geodermatophilus obscurus]